MKAVCLVASIFTVGVCIFGSFCVLPVVIAYAEVFKALSTTVLAAFFVTLIYSISAGSNAQGLSKDFPLQFRLVAQFRTPVLMFVVVPLSFLMWLHAKLRDRVRVYLMDNSIEAHNRRVDRIRHQVREWNAAGRVSIMRTARPNWASMSTKLSSNKGEAHRIVTHDLTSILNVDYDAMTITAEPAVNMGQITHFLVPKGYALQIQVEMESLTIGGLTMGFGMETNSHIIGFFQESVVKYELVTADGDLLNVTADSDPELFYALPWSCGTIGFLTSVTARIVKVPLNEISY